MPSTRRISDAVKKRKKDTKETTDHKNQPTGPSVYHFPIWQEGPPRIVCTTKCWAYVAVMSSDGCVWASGEPEQRRMNETNNTHNNTHTSSWTFPLYFCAFAKEKHASQGDAKKKKGVPFTFVFLWSTIERARMNKEPSLQPFFFFFTQWCLHVCQSYRPFPFNRKEEERGNRVWKRLAVFDPADPPPFSIFFSYYLFFIFANNMATPVLCLFTLHLTDRRTDS